MESLSLSSNHGRNSSSQETDEGYIGDRGSVFLFQPDIRESRMDAKEVELQHEVDLELRLFTCPSEFDANISPAPKKKPLVVLSDEASCCWDTGSPWLSLSLSLSLSTPQDQLNRFITTYKPNYSCNSVAASHSSVASNSVVQDASSHDIVFHNRGRSLRCISEDCTRVRRGDSGFCIPHDVAFKKALRSPFDK